MITRQVEAHNAACDTVKTTRRMDITRSPIPCRFARRLLILLVGASLLAAAGCKDKVSPGTASVQRQAVTGVSLAEAVVSKVAEYYETAGTVKARTTSTVSSRIMGTITSVAVREGDKVSRGQILMTIDDRDIVQKVAAAEKAEEAARQQKTLAEVTWERYRKLFEGKVISQQEFDQYTTQKKVSESAYEQAGAGLAEARVYREFTRIVAPVAGIVTGKMADQGSMAIPGMPLLAIEDPSQHTVDVRADERLLPKLRVGMATEILIESMGRTLQGKIVEVVPSIDPSSRSFLVKIGTAGAGLSSGLYVRVKMPIGEREALFLPRGAIVQKGQLMGVYVASDKGVLSYRLVKTGTISGDGVEILSGLSPHEKVVVSGADKAVDGGEIRQ